MSPQSLMQLHVETLFTRDASGHLLAVNEPGGGPAPRLFLGRTADGTEGWVRHDLDDLLTQDLRALSTRAPVGLVEAAACDVAAPFLNRLDEDLPVQKTWMGPAFCFPPELHGVHNTVRVTAENVSVLSPYFEDWVVDVQEDVPFAAFLEDGKAVSICCSVRMTCQAHEAGVETHRDFRGRDHATKVVTAWAHAVLEAGRIPLYSTSWENQDLDAALHLGFQGDIVPDGRRTRRT